jgi:polysaccharide pyruvyl transferase WcaK-like protein
MNVLALGWFGKGNAGDDRLGEVLAKLLPDVNLCFMPIGSFAFSLANRFDAIIMVAGIFHERSPIITEIDKWINEVKVPIYMLGIGSEYLPNTSKDKIAQLIERAQFVYVRDSESKTILGNNEKIIVGPDLTFFDPFEIVNYNISSNNQIKWLINLRETKFKNINWDEISSRISRVNSKPVAWILEGSEKHIYDNLGLCQRIDFQKKREISGFHYISAMRLHGLIFSIQMGIPFSAISYHHKVDMLMKDIGKSDICFQPFDFHSLINFVSTLDNKYLIDERESLIDIRNKYNKATHDILTNFKEIFDGNRHKQRNILRKRILFYISRIVLKKAH